METVNTELGEYLRARRDLISPAQAGLPEDEPRRVAGLRREEVALLAGVSADYYTRLEQGRERHPSEQVLDAIARALQLDEHAATHLFRLAQPAPSAQARVASASVRPELRTLLDHVVAGPACVLGPALDVLAANALAIALYAGFARLDNIVRMVFLDPAAREFYADWDQAARGAVSNLRAAATPFPDDPRVTAVVGELTVRSPAFGDLWARHEVRPRTGETKHLRHPRVGDLHLHYQGFAVSAAPGQHLYVYSADPGSPSAAALSLLEGSL
ncbi:helix-turn-helix domain-containing protein [Streptomyces sp. MMG1121]|uniref:helix-turn-helix domain-containing protein n=1 Tax=Streptomyces sp. MMG1121 TaxID=1415544 RepID=UPI0006B00173|nr:helix-turn-helix transcriptional regulator [Streptomyces sp. MMG1121]KOV61507.1 XRE family transcriptional regulator [Streptomyces sp. MMG1121]